MEKDFRDFEKEWSDGLSRVAADVQGDLASVWKEKSLCDMDSGEQTAYVMSVASRVALRMLSEYHEWLGEPDRLP